MACSISKYIQKGTSAKKGKNTKKKSKKSKKCMFNFKNHVKKDKNAIKGQKCMFSLKIYAKKGKNVFSISKFIQKRQKMKKKNAFLDCFCLYIRSKEVENNIPKETMQKRQKCKKRI